MAKKGKRAVEFVGGGIGPKPTPKSVNIDYDLVGNVPGKLKEARQEGKQAAGGQLKTISGKASKQINTQLRRADARTDKILRNMQRIEANNKKFSANVKAGISATQAQHMSSGSVRQAGLTGSRSRVAKTTGKSMGQALHAQTQAGKKIQKAEKQAISSSHGIERRADKASLSILDVLAAERKSEDVKFIQSLKQEEKMLELNHGHDLMMQQLQFDQSLYSMEYEQQLNKEYTQWQMDQGLLLTPEEEAALQWRYQKKGITLPYRLEEQKAKKQQKTEQFHNFDNQMSAIEDGIQRSVEVINSPGLMSRAEASFPNLSPREAASTYVSQEMERTVPEGTEMSAVNNAIRDTVGSVIGGGLAPTWNEVQGYIAQTSPDMRDYLGGSPNLKAIHDSYRAIRTAQSPLGGDSPFKRKTEETGDPSFLDQAMGVSAYVAGPLAAVGTLGMAVKAAQTAGVSLPGGASGLLANPAQRTGLRGGQSLASESVKGMSEFLKKPGTFQNVVRNVTTRFGGGNPFGGGPGGAMAGESGAAGAGVLANLGLLAAAGIVSHKLIDKAATEYQFAEAAEDENLQSTFNLLDATAEGVIAGHKTKDDLRSIAADITSSTNAGNLFSSHIGWTDQQKEMVNNRMSVLDSYIDNMINERSEQSVSSYFNSGRSVGATN